MTKSTIETALVVVMLSIFSLSIRPERYGFAEIRQGYTERPDISGGLALISAKPFARRYRMERRKYM